MAKLMLRFCFFFSSRRRHTRCGRDWSSDVCSSDLEPLWEENRERQTRCGLYPQACLTRDQSTGSLSSAIFESGNAHLPGVVRSTSPAMQSGLRGENGYLGYPSVRQRAPETEQVRRTEER